jgi:hypothetical protein
MIYNIDLLINFFTFVYKSYRLLTIQESAHCFSFAFVLHQLGIWYIHKELPKRENGVCCDLLVKRTRAPVRYANRKV